MSDVPVSGAFERSASPAGLPAFIERHTTQHHTGGRKSEDARRSLEAFALLREELKHERALKAELLEALKHCVESLESLEETNVADDIVIEASRAAIAKATGAKA